ncbi:hypothetical protein AB4440_08325 [Vibrio splendidus]|uniref:hypothetical protein n=1 Tax=Vibrio splendidus TaxID=29497 RepID=UPI000C859B86|nr:hypothetical protein [Vibrio splendidus]PMO98221.1 hypothetical protein BCS97_08950 [Vibrio splendidus]PMP29693.1 hypothetical protein BCS89_07070 [Vibrio splendidus]PMP36332.1 hypothetical protein BCS88_07230 [Vibrio splendidus]PMP45991.1 hypothetical protein BCS87_03660 [Vibrio splendidus]PMP48780.1 hypothetical protein BCS85_08520 [Vibrio splendidus]
MSAISKTLIATSISCALGLSSVAVHALDFSPNYSPEYVPGFDHLKVGYGIDPANNIIKIETNYDRSKFISRGNLILDVGSSLKKEYSDFNAGAHVNAEKHASAISGGVGLSYGLLSAQATAAYSSSSSNEGGSVSIDKQTGLMGYYKESLPFDPAKDMTQGTTVQEDTANAILNAMPGVREEINDIRSAYGERRKALVKKFIRNHGTHVITSVTKGYYGQYSATFSRDLNSGSESEGYQASISAKGWGAALHSEGSSESGQSFSKEGWDFKSATQAYPDWDKVTNRLEGLKSELSSEINSSNDFYNLSEAANSAAIKTSLTNMPAVPTDKITPDAEFVSQYKEQKTTRLTAEKTIDEMLVRLASIERSLENSSEQSGNQKVKNDLAYMDENLKKFEPGEQFSEVTLDNKYEIKLSTVKRSNTYLHSKLDSDDVTSEGLPEVSGLGESERNEVVDNQEEFVFESWLKEQLKDEDSDSFSDLSQEELSNYRNAWLGQDEHDFDFVSANSVPSNIILNSTQLPLLASSEDETPQMVVLDFNTVPWALLFPELGGIGIDNYQNMAFNNILIQINDYLNMLEYLSLCITYDGLLSSTGKLSVESAMNKLNTLVDDLVKVQESKGRPYAFKFDEKNFIFPEPSAFIELSKALEAYMLRFEKESNENIDKWVPLYHELKDKGLLLPTGNVLYSQSTGQTTKHKDQDFVFYDYEEKKRPALIGVQGQNQEIGTIISKVANPDPKYPVNTILPVITSQTKVVKHENERFLEGLSFNQFYGDKQSIRQITQAPIGAENCRLALESKKVGELVNCSFIPYFYKSSEADSTYSRISDDQYGRPYGDLVLAPTDDALIDKINSTKPYKSVQLPLYYGGSNYVSTISASLQRTFK